MHRWAVALSGLVLAASCAASEGPNDTDVEFATSMIEHHAEAIQMANVTIGRDGLDPRIAELAEQIRVGQTEEIDTMSGWLRDWGEPVPETGFATGDGHTHSDDGGAGGHADLDALASAPDRRFEARWLTMMIEHHRGAVALADEVVENGESETVADLAEAIRAEQGGEIDRMRSWLGET